jgi:tRNA pseudouridine55 synthase
LSSNAALQRVRRLLRADKAGHVGSLDPLATGMLPICLGEATKIAGEVLSARKRYRFAIQLGTRTATGDREGAVVESAPVPLPLDTSAVTAVLSRFLGRQQQVPPMYSALKRDGQPLYKLARAGVEVERAPRNIEIGELALLGVDGTVLDLDVLCSKGTYVRTLAEDIARALGTCGHVIRLRRIYVEPFEREPMQTLESVENTCRAGALPTLVPADAALPHLPPVRLTAVLAARLSCGQAVANAQSHVTGRVRLYDDRGGFLGIGDAGEGVVRPRRLFVRPLVAGGGCE